MISPMQFLLADKNTVEGFLRETPEDEIIERNSWLGRLDAINEEIAQLQEHPAPKRVNLTYRGAPVDGSRGVASTFALKATRAYTNAVKLVAAQWFRDEPLGERGVVSDSLALDPLIVGTAVGSFGFTLEEPRADQLTIEGQTPVALALFKTQQLLASTLGSDDEIAEAVEGVDSRAIQAVRNFLQVLRNNRALCAIESEQGLFRFEQPGQIERSLQRLEEPNIERALVTLKGAFLGVLPQSREFEFELEDGEIIKGHIAREVSDQQIENMLLYRGKTFEVKARSTRVGAGRPRFVLVEGV